ncbi:hypothetical protein PHYBLDRAFT_149648 [Phycomyces blakesleeanus NRRL 1555(-)]|uniref:Uncharacterized protein n=1 Tax=Phycomyces blakesleeanus (strain ATCC 8743b / DSM 1359 / FGSC 10004 / NBRC 33097 / NRRL 1555) TaxID=763407 RepID=A0A167KZP1_PHYB8|nr:hypothetical protein PHYBLDRAFT_149648 [Phycomyces blakesleeanus NRRL 1555(-)]OAD69247.1 hypothetical protein PHYBLDRAFT_149648 [Phycomyces blakesleeanus NRRL 1555(-)]|eukprot:XP_018287287.1 hypothetical protein PHYBLDRAFT_149648 [Phycomyces blakesleeanus NRRL 1555(-)]
MNSLTSNTQDKQENGFLSPSEPNTRRTLRRPASRSHRLSQGYDMQAGYPEQLSGYEIIESSQERQDGEDKGNYIHM